MYPQTNAARSVRDLSGVWDFRFNANDPWQTIAVPASYNDQSPDPEFRRHYGMAYYRTRFTVPEGARRVLRFDAVTHNAAVRLNGEEIATHRGGFLPFEADITALAQPGETVTLEVEVDNRIGHSTLPVGNEGGTAFFGSDNAGIPAVEAASRCRASTCPTSISSTTQALPARCICTPPRQLTLRILPWRPRWMAHWTTKSTRLETDLPALRS